MGSEWREVTLSELGEVARGRSRHRPRYAEHLYGGKYPFIQTGDVKASGGLITTHSQTYSEAGLAQSRLWPEKTLCITIAANIAETGILTYPACFPDSVIGFIADDSKCDVRFVEYRFRHLKKQIQREAIGSVQDNINLKTIDRLRFSIPELAEQKRISTILGTLDDKILLNRQMNETLEQMAQALFKSWFVDFDPVIDNALDAGNPIPEELEPRAEQRRRLRDAASKEEAPAPSLPDEIRSLFPSEFEFTDEMGWIPKGWKIESINDATELIIDHRGKTPKKLGSDWCEYGYPAISAKNIKSGKLVNRGSIRFVDHDLYQKWMKDPIRPGDIALTSEAPLGELYYFSEKCDYLLSQRLYGLRADHEKCSGAYLYFWLRSDLAWQDLESRATGTTVVGIRQSELRKVKVLIPSANVMDYFSCQANAFLRRVEKQEQQIEQLEKIRDSLLPKLISGELKIPDAEQQIAEVMS